MSPTPGLEAALTRMAASARQGLNSAMAALLVSGFCLADIVWLATGYSSADHPWIRAIPVLILLFSARSLEAAYRRHLASEMDTNDLLAYLPLVESVASEHQPWLVRMLFGLDASGDSTQYKLQMVAAYWHIDRDNDSASQPPTLRTLTTSAVLGLLLFLVVFVLTHRLGAIAIAVFVPFVCVQVWRLGFNMRMLELAQMISVWLKL